MLSYFQRFTAYLKQALGTSVDYDKAYGAQCVDQARDYANKMGSPIGTFSGSAINGWNTGSPFRGTKWRRITYTRGAIPNTGDIIFFSARVQKYGHVAVVSNATATTVEVVEQNAIRGTGTGLGVDAITQRAYLYKGGKTGDVLGWYTTQY